MPGAVRAQSAAAGIAGPHGEHGTINHVNGEDYISYEFVAAPGAQHTPAVFKVFRPRTDPPEGLPKPRIAAGNAGSWAFIGEGSLAYMSAMMDLDANGVVTWSFMTPDKLEKYRPAPSTAVPSAANAPTPAPQVASSGGPPGWKARDPNFPKPSDAYVAVAPNDFGAENVSYECGSAGEPPTLVEVRFKQFGELMTYLGFNDEGAWLAGGQNNGNRLFVFKAGGIATLTRKPFSTALPTNLRNSPDNNRSALAGTSGFGGGMTAAQEAALNERVKVLEDLDQQVRERSDQATQAMWLFDHDGAKGKQLHTNYASWLLHLQPDCHVEMLSASVAPTWRHAVARNDSSYNCVVAKSRERIAAYEKVMTEAAAKNVTPESWAAVASTDPVTATTGSGPAPQKRRLKNDPAQQPAR